jgi:hypothetical protein
MNDLVKSFMESMQVPEQFRSTASKNVYHVIAKKDTSKLAVSLMPNIHVDGKNPPTVALVLRFIEVVAQEGDQPVFKGFDVRQRDDFVRVADDVKIRAFRGEKHILPVTHQPVSGYDFHMLLEENNVLYQIAQFIQERVTLAGGEVTVTPVSFLQVLEHQLASIPHDKPAFLFKLPIIKGYNDESAPDGADQQ